MATLRKQTQASSMVRMRFTGSGLARARCSHAAAHTMRIASASDWYTAERSKLTRGVLRSMTPLVGPSNIPFKSPWQRRCNSSAASRLALAREAASVASLAAAPAVGRNKASTTSGRVGSPPDTRLASSSATAQAARSSGDNPRRNDAEMIPPSTDTSSSAILSPGRPVAPAGPGPQIPPFGAQHPSAFAKPPLSIHITFHKPGLAESDLADDQHVRPAEALAVQLPGVVAEGPAVQIIADIASPAAEPALG